VDRGRIIGIQQVIENEDENRHEIEISARNTRFWVRARPKTECARYFRSRVLVFVSISRLMDGDSIKIESRINGQLSALNGRHSVEVKR
jgi:hypothetical protein